VVVSCPPGFEFSSGRGRSFDVHCQLGGKWTENALPNCQQLTCSSLPKIANGRLSLPQPFQFGDAARVHCDAGFRADGPEEVKCLANQSLSTVPSCRDVNECAEGLAQCQEASTKCVNLPGGYTCQCLSGFQPQLACPTPSALVASSLVTSSESVTPTTLSTAGWCAAKSDKQQSITLHFTVPKVIEKIRLDKMAEGEVTSIRIRYHEEEGRPLRELAVDGKDIELFGCQKSSCADVNECMKDNGHCDQICVNKQGSYKCACREGYDLFTVNGQGGVELKEGETGEHPLDVIKLVQQDVHTTHMPTDAFTGQWKTIEHIAKVQLSHARSSPLASFRECVFDPKPDGREYWLSGPPADCPFVDCGPPPVLAGAVYEGDHSSYKVGSTLTFTCRPPYSLVGKSSAGDKSVRCGVDASWDLGDLRCEGPVCVDPGFPDDGSIELNSVEEGAVAKIYTLTTLRMAGVAGSGYLRGHVTKMQLFYKTQFSQNYDTYPVEFETPSGNHNAMHQFELTPPLRARYILLGVAEYEGSPCIRFDLLGCLAPMTLSHEVPAHLQVGWNGSVPQCMDAEPPSFQNCPPNPIFAETDENGQIRPIRYEEPKAEDNSGRVAYVRVEPVGFTSGRLITSDIDVVYTAFDDAGNTAECVVKLRIPESLSSAKHVVKKCSKKDDTMICTISCEEGYRFVDQEKVAKEFTCESGRWSPSGVAQACVP
ncbi:sushi domain protein, partial [Teladorsagia circumcincta]